MKTQDVNRGMTKTVSKFGIAALFAWVAAGLLLANLHAQPTTPASSSVDPATHAAHVAAGTHPAPAAKGDPVLAQQLSELRVKVAQLEAALAKNTPRPSAATPAAGAMPGMTAPAAPMTGMSGTAPGAMKPASGMGGMAAPPGGAMNMMGMMDKMMGMMDKMMSMSGGAMPAGAPMSGGGMGMGMMQSEMGGMGGGAMPAGAPAAGMSGGGGMGMDKMEMAGMMGMGAMGSGAAGTMPQSALPGFPGASHLYHIGATDFFLDHPQHIALTTEQKAALNKAKEQALLAKSTADRAIQQAEQELWTLTAADQPDAAAIETKIAEIGKLAGAQRLAFIRAVGDASKLLTDQQRKILTGFAPPAPAAAMPAGGMKDM
jgi:Spy/CpxP family protein refolding chaperone